MPSSRKLALYWAAYSSTFLPIEFQTAVTAFVTSMMNYLKALPNDKVYNQEAKELLIAEKVN